MSCGVGCRRCSAPTSLWLWHRPAAIALIPTRAWEPPYAEGVALEMAKRPKKKSLNFILIALARHIVLNMKVMQFDLYFRKTTLAIMVGDGQGVSTLPLLEFLGQVINSLLWGLPCVLENC